MEGTFSPKYFAMSSPGILCSIPRVGNLLLNFGFNVSKGRTDEQTFVVSSGGAFRVIYQNEYSGNKSSTTTLSLNGISISDN